VAEDCDWIRAGISKAMEKYEDVAFRAGQRAAGMTRGEAEKVHKEDEEELHAAFSKMAGIIDNLVVCEIRTSGGRLEAPEEPEPSPAKYNSPNGSRTIVVTSPDCEGCKALLAKVRGKDITIVDLSTDDGITFIERCLDEGINFEDVPAVLTEENGKLRLLNEPEAKQVLAV